jgi:Coenzyme PQQ synthesis protein D (PqqD)
MKSSPSEKDNTLSRTEALACIPKQNDTTNWVELENGDILFTYAIPLSRFFQALHRKFTKNRVETATKSLQLDAMGSFVWKLIDGERSVGTIITTFAKEYKVGNMEAETAVTSFIKTLGQRGFIGLF